MKMKRRSVAEPLRCFYRRLVLDERTLSDEALRKQDISNERSAFAHPQTIFANSLHQHWRHAQSIARSYGIETVTAVSRLTIAFELCRAVGFPTIGANSRRILSQRKLAEFCLLIYSPQALNCVRLDGRSRLGNVSRCSSEC